MKKILVIVNIPVIPRNPRKVPLENTLFYEMLGWVGIDKEEAQQLFTFEAIAGKFKYSEKSGFIPPTQRQMLWWWHKTLKAKYYKAEKCLVLGNMSRAFLLTVPPEKEPDPIILCLIHPAKRNARQIIEQKEEIIKKLKYLLNKQSTTQTTLTL